MRELNFRPSGRKSFVNLWPRTGGDRTAGSIWPEWFCGVCARSVAMPIALIAAKCIEKILDSLPRGVTAPGSPAHAVHKTQQKLHLGLAPNAFYCERNSSVARAS
ncbi:unnamed protein product, partial [Iphiclides podalirius]